MGLADAVRQCRDRRRPRRGTELQGPGDVRADAHGLSMDGRRWVDTRFHSAFAMLTRPFGSVGLSARVEAFDTRNKGSLPGPTNMTRPDGPAWSPQSANFGRFTGLVEVLHVSSRTPAREHAELSAAPAPDPAPGAAANPLVTMFAGRAFTRLPLNLQPWCVTSCCSRQGLPAPPRCARPRCRCACVDAAGRPVRDAVVTLYPAGAAARARPRRRPLTSFRRRAFSSIRS